MTGVKVILWIIVFYMVSLLTGSLFVYPEREKRFPVLHAVIYGVLAQFALFSAVFSVCMLLASPFRICAYVWGALCLTAALVGLIKNGRRLAEVLFQKKRRPGKEALVLFLVAAAQMACSLFFQRTGYAGMESLAPAVRAFEQGQAVIGESLFPLWFAAAGQLCGVHPAALALGYSGLMLLPAVYMAFFLLGERFFSQEKKYDIFFALACGLFLWIGSPQDLTFSFYQTKTIACTLLLPAECMILWGLNRKNAKNRIGLTVLLLAAGVSFGAKSFLAVMVLPVVFVLVRTLYEPCIHAAAGIKAAVWDKNKEKDLEIEEGENRAGTLFSHGGLDGSSKSPDDEMGMGFFMKSKRGRLFLAAALLMISVMVAFVFCIFKLNSKINSVFLITQQLTEQLAQTDTAEEALTEKKIDEMIVDRVETLTGEKPKNFTISRFTEADGMSFITCDTGSEETYRLYQVDMNEDAGGLGYVLQLPGGQIVVIDGGYEGDGAKLYDFIAEHGGVVSAWILTHPHYDHIGAFLHCMTQETGDIEVQSVYYSPFTEEFFETEGYENDELEYEALRFEEFEEIRKSRPEVSFIPVSKGDRIQIENMVFECLSSFDAQVNDVNDNSLVLRADMNGVSMMVTGDITEKAVERMVSELGEENEVWDVDFLQIPHHGYTGTGEKLYELTRPRFTLLDCSTKEYTDDVLGIQSETIDTLHEMGIGIVKRFEGTNVVVIK